MPWAWPSRHARSPRLGVWTTDPVFDWLGLALRERGAVHSSAVQLRRAFPRGWLVAAVLAASAAAGGCKVQSEPASDPGAVDAEAYCGNGVVDWGETCDQG